MYKVLTVDDEPFVRVSLASLRTWQDDGFDFCYEASNGQQALEILEKYQDISIILLDLIMPVLDGISFLEKFNALKTSLKNFSPSVIVLSSHDSFALVRQAFTLGVSDYVLKTEIEEDNLLNLLKKAIEKQPQETKINTLTFEEEHRDFLRSQLLHDLLINPPSEDCTEMLTRLGLSFSLPLVLCSLRILDFDTVAARFSQDEAGHFNELLIRTIRMIMGKDWSGEVIQVTRDQSAIFLTAPQEYENIIPLQNALKESLERYLNIRIELNFSPELRGLDEVSEVWSRLIKPATGGSRIVVLAKRYLTEHYKESKISLSDLSAFVGVSRNHLSWEFTRETGETITEYLAHLRMNEAAQLLRTTTLKVYEVAEQLGYSNVEHFSRIFKKVMGVSPNHYTGAQDA